MKSINHFKGLFVLLGAILLVNATSCTYDNLDEFSKIETEQNLKVSIEWTAFKFPTFEDRVGVSGSFDSLEYSLTRSTGNIIDQLMDSEITIPTSSVNVGNNSTKTSNVSKYFFNYFTTKIDCKVINIDHESAEIAISMNDVTEHTKFEVELDEENKIVKLSGSIEDLMIFGAETAFAELNEVCGIFHDGFVWPDITINVTIENYDSLN